MKEECEHSWKVMTEEIKLRDIRGTKVKIELSFCYQCGLFDDVYPS